LKYKVVNSLIVVLTLGEIFGNHTFTFTIELVVKFV